MSQIEWLDFDTKLFGLAVAKIVPADVPFEALCSILNQLKAKGGRLIYWASAEEQKEAVSLGGKLVDRKVTYFMPLSKVGREVRREASIEEYTDVEPNDVLIQLAVQAGSYSRFKVDSRLSETQFKKIYFEWIKNSVNHTIAQHVLMSNIEGKTAGMITLGEKSVNGALGEKEEKRGDIGLLAVHEDYRGLGVGKSLVHAAQLQFIKEGYEFSQVVTQLDNLPACRLYEKCGYTKEKIEWFYHFWL